MVNDYKKLVKAFESFKKKAGDIKYVACFGKTFLSEDAAEYKLAGKIAEAVIGSGYGVIHGGYIGAMKAVSLGASRAIVRDSRANDYWNVGVPMQTFDASLKRSSPVNLPTAKDISDRKKALVELCDICVVLPSGGFGTLVEALEIFHCNQLAEKFGGKIRPLLFVGSNWKELMRDLYKKLNMKDQKGGDSFCYFVKTPKQITALLAKFN